MSEVTAGPATIRTPEETEENKNKARRDIRNALWEGTNYLGYKEWHSYVLAVMNEIITDWD